MEEKWGPKYNYENLKTKNGFLSWPNMALRWGSKYLIFWSPKERKTGGRKKKREEEKEEDQAKVWKLWILA